MRFEWDPVKDAANREKHGLSFQEASELFSAGADFLEIYDEVHSLARIDSSQLAPSDAVSSWLSSRSAMRT